MADNVDPAPSGCGSGLSIVVIALSTLGAAFVGTLIFSADLSGEVVSFAAGMTALFLAAAGASLWWLFRHESRTARLGRSYAERLTALTTALRETSADVDKILAELSEVALEREAAARKLELQLAQLTDREQELQQSIQQLNATPIPVVEHFATLTAAGERRSARRDYFLFALGVLVSTLISIVFLLIQQT